jgi:1,4-alpha-glucan branching enzyme
MGAEFGQEREWNHSEELDWHLLAQPDHAGLCAWVHDLNALYRSEPALHTLDCDPGGFEWIEGNDAENSVLAFVRHGTRGKPVLVVVNFTPVPRRDYRIGVPLRSGWREVLNSDAEEYGGSGVGNWGRVIADYVPWHGFDQSIGVSLPPLGVLFLQPE